MLEPEISTAGTAYVEWLIEEAGASCCIMLGVTALVTAVQGGIQNDPSSRMYHCKNSTTYPGGLVLGVSGRRAAGDRVGLLVQQGRLSVLVNGARLGPGPMAGDPLPPRARFCAEMCEVGARVRLVAGARPPPGS